MELRCGVDLVEIDRVRKSIENIHFLERVFGPRERKEREGRSASAYAGAFCAKEAFSKALGTGIRDFRLTEVELLHDELGKPYFVFSGRALALVEEQRLRFDVSISHTETLATAYVIAWRK